MDAKIHVFERAGLGKAPFRFVGSHVSKYQACPGAPIQPGSSYDYCSQGIMQVYRIRSADGREFKVGCDCVLKTADRGLVDVVKREVAKARRESADKRCADLVAEARVALQDEHVSEYLKSRPHPFIAGKTELDYVQYMFAFAGRQGRTRAAKLVMSVSADLSE